MARLCCPMLHTCSYFTLFTYIHTLFYSQLKRKRICSFKQSWSPIYLRILMQYFKLPLKFSLTKAMLYLHFFCSVPPINTPVVVLSGGDRCPSDMPLCPAHHRVQPGRGCRDGRQWCSHLQTLRRGWRLQSCHGEVGPLSRLWLADSLFPLTLQPWSLKELFEISWPHDWLILVSLVYEEFRT